jgi:hypothetical protein
MQNLIPSDEPRDFFVYVDPHCPHVKSGGFETDSTAPAIDALMFMPNPNFSATASPFQNNLVRNYMAEYHLETARKASFSAYPARLQCIFLLPTERAADHYSQRHPNHVRGRTLRRVRTCGSYVYSEHDSAWIDYLRLPAAHGNNTIANAAAGYWQGEYACTHSLYYNDAPWVMEPITEILYLGRIEFYSNVLEAPFQRAG